MSSGLFKPWVPHFSVPVGWRDHRSAQSLRVGQLRLVGNRGRLGRMQTSDNTRSGGPNQPCLAQQSQANRCPNSAANLSLKVSATLSCSLSSKWSANFPEMERRRWGRWRRIIPNAELRLVSPLPGTLLGQLLPQTYSPLPLHPRPGSLPTCQPAPNQPWMPDPSPCSPVDGLRDHQIADKPPDPQASGPPSTLNKWRKTSN